MYRIAILEDEIWISTLIRTFVQKNFHQVELIGECQNGRDALQLIDREHPDIALVDINVPLLNGLDVIAEASRRNIGCKFVIITGYKDFEYVHQALKSGVSDYLLKPVEESELCTVLRRIMLELEQEQNKQRTIATSSRLLHMHFLKNLMFQDKYEGLDVWDLSQYNLHFAEHLFCCSIFKIVHQQLNYILPHTLDAFMKTFESRFDELLVPLCHDAFFCLQGSYITLVLNPRTDSSYRVYENLSKLFDTLLDCAGAESLKITAGLGTLHTSGIRGLCDSYHEAAFALQARISLGSNRLILYGQDIQKDLSQEQMQLSTSDRQEAARVINTHDNTGLTRWFNRLLDDYLQRNYLQDEETLNILPFINCIAECFCTQLSSLKVITLHKGQLLDQLEVCSTITQLRTGLLNQMLQLNTKAAQKLEESAANTSISLACRYIEEHLSEPLTLEAVASQVFLNSNYLSDLFKAETGTNFKDYITEKRMEKACSLLKTPMRIADIALQAGYRDAKHFSKAFKKFVGISPKEYQRIHS